MQETSKIWMNGELVDWADATVHVGTHGLHYGSGVFEGIRAYETPRGTAVFRLTEHFERLAQLGEAPLHGAAVLGRRAQVGDLGSARRERAARVLPAPDRVLRLRHSSASSSRGNPVDVAIMSWPWGSYLGEEGAAQRHPREDLELAADRPERHPARREGDRRLPQLDARGRSRRTAPATRRRSCSRRTATSPTARARTSSSSRTASSTRPISRRRSCRASRATRSSRSRRISATASSRRTLIRTDLYLADEVFMCGTAAEVTPIREVDDHVDRPARARDARDPGGVPRHRARPQRAVGAVARVRARGEDAKA